jgi:pimeloyl-ACP methyl ester carboxylesterase
MSDHTIGINMYTESFVKNKNLNIWTEAFIEDNPQRLSVILINGAGAPARFWTEKFCNEIFNAGFNVIRFDHRDSGLSDAVDWDKNPYTIEDLSGDVIQIMDTYGIQRAHVVGHSMGGIVAQWLAIKHSERLLGFTSMSVATCGLQHTPSKEIMHILMQNNPSQHFENDLPAFMRSWRILNGSCVMDEDAAIKYTQDLYIRSKHTVGVAWHHIWCEQDYLDIKKMLQEITVPGLFIHGELDPLIPVEGARETHRLTPGSNLVIIPSMGHMIFNRNIEQLIIQSLLSHWSIVNP